jgi:hypothetical protein
MIPFQTILSFTFQMRDMLQFPSPIVHRNRSAIRTRSIPAPIEQDHFLPPRPSLTASTRAALSEITCKATPYPLSTPPNLFQTSNFYPSRRKNVLVQPCVYRSAFEIASSLKLVSFPTFTWLADPFRDRCCRLAYHLVTALHFALHIFAVALSRVNMPTYDADV